MNNIICDTSEYKQGTNKTFQGVTKSLRNDSSDVALLGDNGTFKSTPLENADTLNKQFSIVFVNSNDKNYPDLGSNKFSPMYSKRCSYYLDPHKAAGLDAIKPVIIKKCAYEIAPIFTRLFNMSLQNGTIPSD